MAARELEPIGVRLRRLRLERGLSQRELAGPGVSYAYISRIEAGTRRPSVKALRTLARTLNVSPEYLETGSELRAVDERELRLADAELELRIGDAPDEARAAFAALLEEATDAGDLRSAVRAEAGLGLVGFRLNDPQAAVAHLEAALESGALTPVDRPDAYGTLARSYALLGRHEQAVSLLESCLRAVDGADGDHVSAHVRYADFLGATLIDVGELARAEEVLGGALARAEDGADAYARVRLYWSIARLSEREGQPMRALEHARRAIALLEATEDTRQLGRAHLLRAWIMGLEGKASEAAPHLDAAERLLGSDADPVDLGMLRVEQSKLAAQDGRGGDAVGRAREALEIVNDADVLQGGSAWSALADGLALERDVDGAIDAFRRAVDLLDGTGSWREAAQTCRRWATVLRDSGRDAEALDALERATDYGVRSSTQRVRVPR